MQYCTGSETSVSFNRLQIKLHRYKLFWETTIEIVKQLKEVRRDLKFIRKDDK